MYFRIALILCGNIVYFFFGLLKITSLGYPFQRASAPTTRMNDARRSE